MRTIRYGIFSDLHSNMEAFAAVLRDMREHKVTHPICLGDIVGYNASPKECLQLVKTLACPVIRGNHDDIVSGTADAKNFNSLAGEGISYSKRKLSESDRAYLRALPFQLRISDFTIVHASLDDPANWNYVNSDLEAESSFTYQKTRVCFCGHTHIPKVFVKERDVKELPPTQKMELKRTARYLINVGAVGQPRDRDWRASYVIYSPEQNMVEFRRLAYDIDLAQRKIVDNKLPEPLAHRLTLGA